MKKVLIVLYNLSQTNGVANCIMQYYDTLVSNGYKVDFLLMSDEQGTYIDKIQSSSSVRVIPQECSKYSAKSRRYISKLMQDEGYSIVHVNIPGPFGVMILKMAKKRRAIPIYHTHNPKVNDSIKGYMLALICDSMCTEAAQCRLACSKDAGDSTFGKKDFSILRNCIDVSKFAYDATARDEIRKELGVNEDTILIGSVGRIEKQKNPFFALQCIKELRNIRRDFYYVWVGRGSLLEEVGTYITDNKMESYVAFVGAKKEIHKWYSAMDCFLLPSNYEGLGIAFIEAQASGLACFGSENVPNDTEVTTLMNRVNLKTNPSEWAALISNVDFQCDRISFNKQVAEAGYNISQEKEALLNIYNGVLGI